LDLWSRKKGMKNHSKKRNPHWKILCECHKKSYW
jgi:hypothetical protein